MTTRPLDGGGEGLRRDPDGFAPEGCFGGITVLFMNKSSAVSLLASKALREGQEDAAAPRLPAERGRDCLPVLLLPDKKEMEKAQSSCLFCGLGNVSHAECLGHPRLLPAVPSSPSSVAASLPNQSGKAMLLPWI